MGAHVASQDDVKSPDSDGALPYQRGHLPPRFLSWSRITAPTMMHPLTICCQKAETFIKSRVLFNTPIISAPIIVPATVPIPPAEREVPPMTAAAMASSS